jgi:hypothetical protein
MHDLYPMIPPKISHCSGNRTQSVKLESPKDCSFEQIVSSLT